MIRCPWVPKDNSLYEHYHDTEWGVVVKDDRTLFEFLILEGAQAGLSWETILKRRQGYKKAFANFDVTKVSKFDENDFLQLLNNPEIIRNKLKIKSAINNAKIFIQIQKEFGSFYNYQLRFLPDKRPIVNSNKTLKDYLARDEISDKFSLDLKKRGMSFVGSTIIYAHMQAVGMINDHTVDCFRYNQV